MRKIALGLPGVVLGLFAYLTQVSPEDVTSNLAKWPPWLTDTRTMFVVAILVVGFYAFYVGSWWSRRARLHPANGSKPDNTLDYLVKYLVDEFKKLQEKAQALAGENAELKQRAAGATVSSALPLSGGTSREIGRSLGASLGVLTGGTANLSGSGAGWTWFADSI